MAPSNAKIFRDQPGLRVAGAVAATLALLLGVLAIVRPEMMGMATLHQLLSAMR